MKKNSSTNTSRIARPPVMGQPQTLCLSPTTIHNSTRFSIFHFQHFRRHTPTPAHHPHSPSRWRCLSSSSCIHTNKKIPQLSFFLLQFYICAHFRPMHFFSAPFLKHNFSNASFFHPSDSIFSQFIFWHQWVGSGVAGGAMLTGVAVGRSGWRCSWGWVSLSQFFLYIHFFRF